MSVYPSSICKECGNEVWFSSCSGVNGHQVGHNKNCKNTVEVDGS